MLTIDNIIIIPQQNNANVHINEMLHLRYLREIAKEFGGYTETEGMGGWISPKGTLYHEKVYIITISTPLTSIFRVKAFLFDLGHTIKIELDQESVFVNIARMFTFFIT